ncbi:MAG: ABC transporter ATP-binding protein [Candidatus Izimaplasma sp.]|nr:ABC transporter ATP-binding protein [Candidatus Izimaplasma bacterium]
MIKVENLTKSYDENIPVLDEINFTVNKGEVYGFIGKNGAGKTTTINILLSLIHKDEGTIYFDNLPIEFLDLAYKKRIGFVPDVPVFPGYLTTQEYLKQVCNIFHVSYSNIDKVLEFVSLDTKQKKISSFSRGMKQRLAIAQALIHDPDMLIMDEPMSALDPEGRKDILDIMLSLKGDKTIFYSTHILEDVEKVCDRVALIHNGKIVFEEDIDSIKSAFVNKKVYIEPSEELDRLYKLLNKNIDSTVVKKDKGVYIELKQGLTINKLLKMIIDESIELTGFKQVNASLEDIFLEVINND